MAITVLSAGLVGWIQIAVSSAASPTLCTGAVSTVAVTGTVAAAAPWIGVKSATRNVATTNAGAAPPHRTRSLLISTRPPALGPAPTSGA